MSSWQLGKKKKSSWSHTHSQPTLLSVPCYTPFHLAQVWWFNPGHPTPNEPLIIFIGGRRSLGHLTLSWIPTRNAPGNSAPSRSVSVIAFWCLLGQSEAFWPLGGGADPDVNAPYWSFGAFDIALSPPGYLVPCRTLPLFLLFWRTSVLKLVNNIKKRVPSGWNAPSDSKGADQ